MLLRTFASLTFYSVAYFFQRHSAHDKSVLSALASHRIPLPQWARPQSLASHLHINILKTYRSDAQSIGIRLLFNIEKGLIQYGHVRYREL